MKFVGPSNYFTICLDMHECSDLLSPWTRWSGPIWYYWESVPIYVCSLYKYTRKTQVVLLSCFDHLKYCFNIVCWFDRYCLALEFQNMRFLKIALP